MRLNSQLVESMRAAGYVTTTEAARLTKHPAKTIRFWCNNKGLKHRRDGEAYFVELASLRRRAGEQEKPT